MSLAPGLPFPVDPRWRTAIPLFVDIRLAVSLWLRGGFPDAFTARSDAVSARRRFNFIRTYLERGIPLFGVRMPAETLRRYGAPLLTLGPDSRSDRALSGQIRASNRHVHFLGSCPRSWPGTNAGGAACTSATSPATWSRPAWCGLFGRRLRRNEGGIIRARPLPEMVRCRRPFTRVIQCGPVAAAAELAGLAHLNVEDLPPALSAPRSAEFTS